MYNVEFVGLFFTKRCQLCTTPLRQSAYVWQTPQGNVKVCPKCNSRLENQKSRAVFDSSKPFVFPPIVRSSSSGCGGFISVIFIAFIGIAVISALSNTKTGATLAPPTKEPNGSIQPKEVKPETPSSTASVNTNEAISSEHTKTEMPSGSGVLLKNTSNFPVAIIVTRKINILNETGGFGLAVGDELLILRKQGTKYIVSHQNKEYAVNPNLIEDMEIK